MIDIENKLSLYLSQIFKRVFRVNSFDLNAELQYNMRRVFNSTFRKNITLMVDELISKAKRDAIRQARKAIAENVVIDEARKEQFVNETINIILSLTESIKDEILRERLDVDSLSLLNQHIDELQKRKFYRMDNFLRTFVNQTYNDIHLIMYEHYRIPYLQFLATVDNRTSYICLTMNKTIFEINDPRLAIYTPPLHFRCRSRMVPLFKADKKLFFEQRFSTDAEKLSELKKAEFFKKNYSIPSIK